MTTSAREDLHVLDIGPPAWCWARLAGSSEATLSFSTPHGRHTVEVRYTLDHEQIAIAMPSLDAVGWQAAGRSAVVKISGTTHDQLRWSVRAAGHAHRAGDHLLSAAAARRSPAAELRPAWLALSSLQVRGYYETIMLDSLPPDCASEAAGPVLAGSGDRPEREGRDQTRAAAVPPSEESPRGLPRPVGASYPLSPVHR